MSATQALMDYTFVSKYARWLKNEKRRETWEEAVNRVREMMHEKYEDKDVHEDIDFAYDMMRRKRVLGSQRCLQYGGQPALQKNARVFNCTASYCDRLRVFQEAFWLLLCGCGVGLSIQKHHINKLPKLSDKRLKGRKRSSQKFVVPDTIEGWADCVGVLLTSYYDIPVEERFEKYVDAEVEFDYSKIRPGGSFLSSGVGKAPGPDGLRTAVKNIQQLLDARINEGRTKLAPIDCGDIFLHTGEATLSGGVRRSSGILLFSADDKDMRLCKTGNWLQNHPQRARANISEVLHRETTDYDSFKDIIQYTKEYGDPGFMWVDDLEELRNPCVTKDTMIVTKDGLDCVEHLNTNKSYFTTIVDGEKYNSTFFYQTGNKPVYEVQFKSGRILKLTGNHRIMRNDGVWKKLDDLNIGDKVKVHNHRELLKNIDRNSKEYAQGYCLGHIIGDGYLSHTDKSAHMCWWGKDRWDQRTRGFELLNQAHFDSNSQYKKVKHNNVRASIQSTKLYSFLDNQGCIANKELTIQSICGNWSYLSGLLAGYFDADGYVVSNTDKGCCVRLTSISLSNLQLVQNILNAFGINSTIYKNRLQEGYYKLPDGHGDLKQYWCNTQHDLHISKDNLVILRNIIKFEQPHKERLLNDIIDSYIRKPYRDKFEDTIESISLLPEEDVFDCTVSDIEAFSANGVYVHNCGEIGMWAYDIIDEDKFNKFLENYDGQGYKRNNKNIGLESGWQMCNLGTINAPTVRTIEEYHEWGRAAAIITTLQSGFTEFGYLTPASKHICERESLIGVSITGIMENEELILESSNQRKVARTIKQVNTEIANKIGINPAARCTTIKPEGTGSLVLGVSSGIHPHHSKRYLRRIQANITENPYQHFKTTNPLACEKSVWAANDTDEIALFPIEVKDGAKLKNQLPALTLLEIVKSLQQNWIRVGKTEELCTRPCLSHNVSNTIQVKPDEWDEVTLWIYRNRNYISGITLLPQSGDKDYPQAPFTAVYLPHEIVREYGDAALWTSGLIEIGLRAFNNNLWSACDFVLIPEQQDNLKLEKKSLKLNKAALKFEFVEKMEKFANKYFDNDVRRLTYCMKDVFNWKLYHDLKKTFKAVDYTTMREDEDNTKPEAEPACAGGACFL